MSVTIGRKGLVETQHGEDLSVGGNLNVGGRLFANGYDGLPTTTSDNAGIFTSGLSFGNVIAPSTTEIAIRASTYVEQSANFRGSFVSTSADDSIDGDGAWRVTLVYCTRDGVGPKTEIVTLHGDIETLTMNDDVCYIEKMHVSSAGTMASNVGVIKLLNGTQVVATINATKKQTMWAHHYVPINKTMSIHAINCGKFSSHDGCACLKSVNPTVFGGVELQISDDILIGVDARANARSYSVPLTVNGFARVVLYARAVGNNVSWVGSFEFREQ